MLYNTPAYELFDLVQKDFAFPLKNRLHIAAEVAMYRKGEDESVWKQDRSGQYEYQVFFDGEFVCFFDMKEDKKVAYVKVLKGLRDLYQQKKIFWNESLYEIFKPKPVEEPQLPEATTKEEKIIKELVVRAKKQRTKKKKTEHIIKK